MRSRPTSSTIRRYSSIVKSEWFSSSSVTPADARLVGRGRQHGRDQLALAVDHVGLPGQLGAVEARRDAQVGAAEGDAPSSQRRTRSTPSATVSPAARGAEEVAGGAEPQAEIAGLPGQRRQVARGCARGGG